MTAKLHAKGIQTRDAILSTASRLFDKKGVFGTSIDDISREQGIAKGTLYQYFASKEDLAIKTVRWSEGILIESLEETAKKGPTDVETAMIEIAHAFFGHFTEYGDFIALYFSMPPEAMVEYRAGDPPFHRLVGTIESLLRTRCAGFAEDLADWELGTLAFMNLEAYRIATSGGVHDPARFETDIKRRMRFFAHGIFQRRD